MKKTKQTNDLKDWEEYTMWVEKENHQITESINKINSSLLDDFKQKMRDYEKLLKIYQNKKQKEQKEQDEYDKLPWYKRLFTQNPAEKYFLQLGAPRLPYLPPLIMPIGLINETYEGFMDWKVNKYEKN